MNVTNQPQVVGNDARQSPRGRGRPRKIADPNEIKTPTCRGRGRGRPPKVKVPGDENDQTPKRGRGRPPKVKEPGTEDDQTPKRGRGRPIKVKEPGTEDDQTPKRGRGRPPKVKEPGNEDDQTPKRGRGRPRKEIEPGSEDQKEKRGRGRPQKENDPLAPKEYDISDLFLMFMEKILEKNTILVLPDAPLKPLLDQIKRIKGINNIKKGDPIDSQVTLIFNESLKAEYLKVPSFRIKGAEFDGRRIR